MYLYNLIKFLLFWENDIREREDVSFQFIQPSSYNLRLDEWTDNAKPRVTSRMKILGIGVVWQFG